MFSVIRMHLLLSFLVSIFFSGEAIFAAQNEKLSNNSGGNIHVTSTSKDGEEEKSKKEVSSSGNIIPITHSSGAETPPISTDKRESEKKLRQEINTYIIESYKAQGNKIIKDLATKLTKSIPDSGDRKIAYQKISASLEFRIAQTQDDTSLSETKREILIEFLRHLISLLEKKISELE